MILGILPFLLFPFFALAESITPIYFDFDKAEIKKSEIKKLQKLAQDHDAKYIIVVGQTDTRGGRLYNLALGEERAENVRAALQDLGIKDMISLSYGEEKTKDINHKSNRRVDMIPLYAKPRKHRVLAHLGVGPQGLDKDILGSQLVEVSQEYNVVGGASYILSYKGWLGSLSGFTNASFFIGLGREF